MTQFGSVSCVGANRSMFRGRAIDKGRVAVAAPLQLGLPLSGQCGTFFCGVICGIQFTITLLFIWLLVQ